MKIFNPSLFIGKNIFSAVFFLALAPSLFSQTLIINEVSNGPSGNKEYVEFVVTDTAVVYDCGATAPPCIDIRGWIFDDNSGYHGSSGIAAGAVRFSNNTLWSCVPVGTIILIYNDADPNAAVPAVDISLTDGNCRLVVPISSTLFQTNTTTPGAVACSYPATGWTAGGNWANTLLANPGDCARIVNTSGCEVFSVCWGSASTNTLIYFNSGGSGTDNVWYFNNGDPTNQANWSEGCADSLSCITYEETPGYPNNFANEAFIAQFNNGCVPIPLLTSSIASFTDATCGCNGTATASAAGSIPGYTYTWYDAGFVSIGQTGATATGLCAGTYHVIVESSIGCSDTATVTITSPGGSGLTVGVSASPSSTICAGTPATLTATGATTYTWSPATGLSATTGSTVSANPSGTTTYTVTGTTSGCSGTATITITVNPLPVITVPVVAPVCETASPFFLTATPAGGTWSGPAVTTPGGLVDPSVTASAAVAFYTVTDANGCTATGSTVVYTDDNPTIIINPVADVCAGSPPFNLSVVTTGVPAGWSGPGITNASAGTFDPSVAGIGTHTVSYSATNGVCTNVVSTTINVISASPVTIDPVTPVCQNAFPFALNASPAGGTWSGTGVNASGTFNPGVSGPGTFTITYTVSGGSGCSGTATTVVQVDAIIPINITSPGTLCDSGNPVNLVATPTGGTWSGPGITNPILGTFDPTVAGAGGHSILYVHTNGACVSSSGISIAVVPGPSITITASGPTVFCQGGSVQLTASGAGTLPVVWSNGMTGNTITVTSGGNYYATVTSACVATSNTITVTVNTIDATFTLDPSTGQAPLEVNIVNTTTNDISYYWVVSDTVYAASTDTSITYDTTGYFEITLYVVSADGCIDSLTQTVYVYGEYALIVPNIFTPNGDHTNDVFSIDVMGIKDLKVDIFNRWGQHVHTFYSDALNDGKITVWDGKTKSGDLSSDGVYAFILTANGLNGASETQKGFVTLVR